MKKIPIYALIASLVVGVLLLGVFALFLPSYAEISAEFNPDIALLKLPALILGEIILVMFILSFLILIAELIRVRKGTAFTKKTAGRLTLAACLFGVSLISGLCLSILFLAYTGWSLLTVDLFIGSFVLFGAMNLFLFLSQLISDGDSIREENEDVI
ncbi:DUF2975 domain-containing protein [Guggenheimella bovis]